MKKRTYRKVHVNKVRVEMLLSSLSDGVLVFAIDVAKTDMVGSFVTADGRVLVNIAWKHPHENKLVLALLSELVSAGVSVEAVMESSGTYGEPFDSSKLFNISHLALT